MEPWKEPDWLARQYGPAVYRLAFARTGSRADAEDVMQEVFVRLLKAKPDFADREHAKAWLLRVAANCANDFFRAPWRRREGPLYESLPAPENPEPGGVVEAVLALPPKYRTAVHLYYYEDLSVAEIAAILGKSEGAVKSRLFRARALLREHLGPFEAWLAPLAGTSTSAGVELKAVGVLSDGVTARFYLTARDRVGGRLDGRTSEELPGFSTSMGFDGENDFHLQIKLEKGYSLSARSTAFVYFSDGSVWSSGAEQVSHLPDGQNLRLEGITRENWGQVERIWLITSYTGPLEPIEGDWMLTLDCAAAETWSTGPDFSLKYSGVTVTQMQLSPLGAVVTYTGEEDALAAEMLQVETAAGEIPAWEEFSGWNWGGEGTAIWSFDEPVELESIASITIGGETLPVAR